MFDILIEKFYYHCRNRKIDKESIAAIPLIGAQIKDLLLKDSLDDIKSYINRLSDNDIQLVMERLSALIENENHSIEKNCILSFGSGTVEYIANYSGDKIELGAKHTSDLDIMIGGSAVNYAMRLLRAGYNAIPLMSIGNDERGRTIVTALLHAAQNNGASKAVTDLLDPEDEEIYVPDLETSGTVILVHENQRTIFTQSLSNAQLFVEHARNKTDRIATNNIAPSTIMIGHLYCDAAEYAAGELTSYLLDLYHENALVFANLGNSQINLGLKHWEDQLHKIDLLQLNLEEAKRFFGAEEKNPSLLWVVNKIRRLNINAVITLDKFGAIGIHKDEKDGVILAWPNVNAEDVIDTTGAGDAFAAGLVSQLDGNSDFDVEAFIEAIDTARSWSALACMSIGGAGECPDYQTILDYKNQIAEDETRPVDLKEDTYLTEIISLLDIAFS